MADQKDPNSMLDDAKVRIITKSEIRYEGKLYQINATEKTVALKDVKSFGSEDRCKDKFVPPSDVVYEYIVFRSCEIKDLVVLKDEVAEKNDKEKEKTKDNKTEPRNEVAKERNEKKKEEKAKGESTNEKQNQKPGKSGNFEFDEMIQKLDIIEKNKEENDVTCKKYVGNDFFDDLSTSINKNSKRRDDPYQNRKVAKETFGHVPYQGYKKGNNAGFNKYSNNRRPYKNQYEPRDNYEGQKGGNFKRKNYPNNRNYPKREEYEYVKKEN